jgi:hypothetical protein
MNNWKEISSEITTLLNLQSLPIAITFSNVVPSEVPQYEGNMPEPTSDGRTGKVPTGCVFWMKAGKQTLQRSRKTTGTVVLVVLLMA